MHECCYFADVVLSVSRRIRKLGALEFYGSEAQGMLATWHDKQWIINRYFEVEGKAEERRGGLYPWPHSWPQCGD
jgi:hypothetical protein